MKCFKNSFIIARVNLKIHNSGNDLIKLYRNNVTISEQFSKDVSLVSLWECWLGENYDHC